MTDKQLWARKGEAITCINGHPICDIACDLHIGDGRSPEHFTKWKQPEPDRKSSVASIRCTQCRGVWVKGNTQAGYRFHFADGWR